MQVFSFALISVLCPLEMRSPVSPVCPVSCPKCTSCSLYESPIAQWIEPPNGDWKIVR